MVDRSSQNGFTLLEMLTALVILVLGVTSLLGALSSGLGTRRAAEQRSRAALLVDQVIQDLRSRGMEPLSPVLEPDLDRDEFEIDPITVTDIDGYPGMRYSVNFVTEPEHPDLLLARIRVSWKSEGSDVGIEFRRMLSRSLPLSLRTENRLKQPRKSP